MFVQFSKYVSSKRRKWGNDEPGYLLIAYHKIDTVEYVYDLDEEKAVLEVNGYRVNGDLHEWVDLLRDLYNSDSALYMDGRRLVVEFDEYREGRKEAVGGETGEAEGNKEG